MIGTAHPTLFWWQNREEWVRQGM